MIIGAQMYSIRERAKNTAEIDTAFQTLKNIGYSAVQVSGIAPIAPEELRDISQKHQLPVALTHTDAERLLIKPQTVADEHKIYGCSNIGIGYMPGRYHGSLEGFRQFAKDYEPVAKCLADNGIQLHYHNHDFEFATLEGQCGYDVLVEATAKANWHFVLDTYWVQYADKDVLEYINKLTGRLSCVHLKDMKVEGGERKMSPVGAGIMDFSSILAAFEKAGSKYAFVEQDDAANYGNPFDQMAISFINLQKIKK